MSAFYVQHQQTFQPNPKVRQEGFHLPSNAAHSPAPNSPANTSTSVGNTAGSGNAPNNTFDPAALFGQPIFPDAFNRKYGDHPHSMDFTDTLASMITSHNPNQNDPNHQDRTTHSPSSHPDLTYPTHFDPNSHSHYSASLSFSPSSQPRVPPHQAHHQHTQQHPQQHQDDADSPGSFQSRGDMFFDHTAGDFHPFSPQSAHALSRMNGGHHQQQSSMDGSTADGAFMPGSAPASHPLPAPSKRRSPSSAGVSRSRSRTRTSVAPVPVTGRVSRKRPSISSPSPPPLPGGNNRPQAIIIPGSSHPTHSHSHSHMTNGAGHPMSPLSLHIPTHPQTAPTSWFLPPHTAGPLGQETQSPHAHAHHAHHHSGSFQIPTPDSLVHSGQPFGQHFGSVPLATSPKTAAKEGATREDTASKQQALLNEKRRRRRESHNAVERRRRDNINEKITELSTLLPECLLDPTAKAEDLQGSADGLLSGVGASSAIDDDSKDPGGPKANKGIILRKSVDYIRYLQQLVRAQAARNRDLETQLAHYRPSDGSTSGVLSSVNLDHAVNTGDLTTLSPIDGDDQMTGLILENLAVDDGSFGDIKNVNLIHDGTTSVGNVGGAGMGPGVRASTQGMDTSPSEIDDAEEEEEEQRRGRGTTRSLTGRRRFPGLSAGGADIAESALSETEEVEEGHGMDE